MKISIINGFWMGLILVLSGCIGVAGTPWQDTGGNNQNNQNNQLPDGSIPDSINNINQDGMVGCDPQNFSLKASPPAEVMLVIDRSGSMLEPGATPGMTRWDEVLAAADTALTQFQYSVNFGLLMYPANDECSTSGPQVRVGPGNRGAIMHYLQTATPAGGTPTAAALRNASASLGDFATPGSPQFMILATDGGPNCNYFLIAQPECSCTYASAAYCCTDHPRPCFFGNYCLDDSNVLDVIGFNRATLGMDTFIIGLAGMDEYVNLLNAMATTGGRPRTNGPTAYYPGESEVELAAALQEIAVSVISCGIDLDEAPRYPNMVHIYMDGREVPRDGTRTDGWDYSNPDLTTIELYGEWCDLLRDGEQHNLTATFACIVN